MGLRDDVREYTARRIREYLTEAEATGQVAWKLAGVNRAYWHRLRVKHGLPVQKARRGSWGRL